MEEQKIGATKDYHDDLLHLDEYLAEHAAEIAAEGDKPFELTDGTSEELGITGIAAAPAMAGVALTAELGPGSGLLSLHQRRPLLQLLRRQLPRKQTQGAIDLAEDR